MGYLVELNGHPSSRLLDTPEEALEYGNRYFPTDSEWTIREVSDPISRPKTDTEKLRYLRHEVDTILRLYGPNLPDVVAFNLRFALENT